MNEVMNTLAQKLTDLAQINGSLPELVSDLYIFHGIAIWVYMYYNLRIFYTLELLSQNVIAINDIEDWANGIECRDDVDYSNDVVQDMIFELANPVLCGELSDEHIVSITKRLEQNIYFCGLIIFLLFAIFLFTFKTWTTKA